jgi:hypothetical protein
MIKKSTPLSVIFIDCIKKMKNSYFANIYLHLFGLLDEERLERELEYLFQLSDGKDEFFKKDGKDNWFYIFHKSIRQTDFFQGCYQKKKVELVTDLERKEWKFLFVKVHEKGYDKAAEPKEKGFSFSDEYRRFLHLNDLVRRETEEESIDGHLDSILWNMIHVDGNELYDTFLRMFSEYKLQMELEKPKKVQSSIT